jgi:DNA-binding IclR family transcriptional regulator
MDNTMAAIQIPGLPDALERGGHRRSASAHARVPAATGSRSPTSEQGAAASRSPAASGIAAAGHRAGVRALRQVPAVTRAVAILRLLGTRDDPLGVNAIARALKLVPSTCLHILRALAAEGLVAVDPGTKRYRLGAGLLALARRALSRDAFAELAQPALDRLARRHGVTAIAVTVGGLDHIVVVAISRSDHAVRLHVDIGSRFPALLSATGRCIAAFGGHPWSALERRFRGLRWDRPPSWSAWRAEVESTRAKGYAVDEGNYIRGVTIIAAPVAGDAGPAGHVVVVVGVSEQITEIGVDRIAAELSAAAQGLSRQMGG